MKIPTLELTKVGIFSTNQHELLEVIARHQIVNDKIRFLFTEFEVLSV